MAQFVRQKKIKQVGKKKELGKKFCKITKVQLEKLPVGEKAPQRPRKNVQVFFEIKMMEEK